MSLFLPLAPAACAADLPPVGVVSRINIVSDKVPDISNLEAWKKSFLGEGMTDQEKALAAWRTTVMFQHQDVPPREFLHQEAVVQDPFKIFHVYGYSFCSVACSDVAALARSAGLPVRGWGIHNHSVPEVYWNGGWHMLDASLINYFPRADGTPASVDDIMAAVKEWHDRNPGYLGDEARLTEFQKAEGWTGWKKGPALLAKSPFLDAGGYWPAHSHGWFSTMQEYAGPYSPGKKPFLYEYGYSQGYQLNIQLRPGERLTRNWSNKGLFVNMKEGGAPGCLKQSTGSGPLSYTPKFGDLAPGRVGNGTHEYDVPVNKPTYRTGVLFADNLTEHHVQVQRPEQPGVLVLRMPSNYVYLTGTLKFTAAIPAAGSVVVSYSDNNGLDWREIARTAASGEQTVDLSPLVLRRYDYRLKFVLQGAGTGLNSLRVVHDIQHSQRPLPALAQGKNTITFGVGPAEGTVTVEGATNTASRGKQLVYTDFHPDVQGFDANLFIGSSHAGTLTFPITTPGDLVRLRFGAHYRARDARDGLDYLVSFDRGQSWQTVDRAAGPTAGDCRYTAFAEIPAGTREALVRYAGTSRNATGIFNFRIDADYHEPFGGFQPVQVKYIWEENGEPREHVHVVRQASESYPITCTAPPVMKSIVLELAE